MRKVLVIDDDIITRRMLVKNVENLGYVVVQSSNGRHGWETLWENPDIDLVITDLMMPDMDGREFMKIVRGNQTFQSLPVLLVSGVSSEVDVADLLEFGHAKFLKKPLNTAELREAVDLLVSVN